jgi:hypothetical protein
MLSCCDELDAVFIDRQGGAPAASAARMRLYLHVLGTHLVIPCSLMPVNQQNEASACHLRISNRASPHVTNVDR